MTTTIYDVLKIGRRNATTVTELMQLTGLRSKREVVRRVSEERQRHVICATAEPPGGYYRPESRADVLECKLSLERRARRIFASTRAAAAALKETPGQESFEGKDENKYG